MLPYRVIRKRSVLIGLTVLVAVCLAPATSQRIALAFSDSTPTDFVLLIDGSASMQENDPDAQRIAGAQLFVNLAAEGDRIAVVLFGTDARAVQALTSDRHDLMEALDGARDARGYTDMAEGLEQAYGVLAAIGESEVRNGVVVLLTDGAPYPHTLPTAGTPLTEQQEEQLRQYKERVREETQEFALRGWQLFTIGLFSEGRPSGPAYHPDEGLLAEMSNATGGEYGRASAPRELIECYVDILADTYELNQGSIEPGQRETDFYICGQETRNLIAIVEGHAVEVELTRERQQVTPDSESRDVEGYLVVRVDNPSPGEWTVRAEGQSVEIRMLLVRLSYRVRLVSPVPQGDYMVGEPIPIEASLEGERLDPEETACVSVSVAIEPGSEEIALDRVGDASYSGVFIPQEAGSYTLQPQKGRFIRETESVVITVLPLPAPTTRVPTPMATPSPVPTVTPISAQVPGDGEGGSQLFRSLFVIVVCAIVVALLIASYRVARIHVVRVAEADASPENAVEVELHGWKKVYLGERLSGSYVTLGLPRHYLSLRFWGIVGQAILLAEEGGKVRQVNFSEAFSCHDPDGREVSLKFYEEKATGRGLLEENGLLGSEGEGPLWKEDEQGPPRGPLA
jgi:Mg-chelatase subunit ChlD